MGLDSNPRFNSAGPTGILCLSPDVKDAGMRFRVKPGWLVDAVGQADGQDFLLVIDEINRADLGRVLGEAIYLFEPKEIAEGKGRKVRLPQMLDDGTDTLQIPRLSTFWER